MAGSDRLLVAEGDAPAREVVRAQLDPHPVADEDADVELAHLSRGVGQDILSGLQTHLEHRVGQRLDDGRVHLDGLFLDLDLCSAVSRVSSTDGAAPAGAAGTGWTSCQTGSPCSRSNGGRAYHGAVPW